MSCIHVLKSGRGEVPFYFWRKRPGASGASWIRFETAGSPFLCIYHYLHLPLVHFLESGWIATLFSAGQYDLFCVYNDLELLRCHVVDLSK